MAAADVTITASASDSATFRTYSRLTVDGGTWSAPPTFSVDRKTITVSRRFTGMKEGNHSATVWFITSAGSVASRSWSFTLEVPPLISATQPASEIDTLTPTVAATITDPAGIAGTPELTIDGTAVAAAWNPATGKLSWTSPNAMANDSSHTVEVRARDTRGNEAVSTWGFQAHSRPKMTTADCTVCHQGFPLAAHPFETVRCYDCHLKLGNLHEWDPAACVGCHQPHPRDFLVPVACTRCHGDKPQTGHLAAKTPSHRTPSSGFASCQTCHDGELHREHSGRTEEGGAAMTCQSCHSSAKAKVKTAIAASDTRCGACHTIDGDHADKHEAPVIESCTGSVCHSGGVVSVHMDVRCDTCHGSARAEVLSAIANHDRSCAACHDQVSPHGDLNAIHTADAHTGGVIGVWSNHSAMNGAIPRAYVQQGVECGSCHGSTNLLKLHGSAWDNCNLCHLSGGPRSGFDQWDRTCQEAGCHATDSHDIANAQVNHIQKSCWSSIPAGGCHNNSMDQISCASNCHTRAVGAGGEATPPVTGVSYSVESTTFGSRTWFTTDTAITLTATDSGSGVAAVYFRKSGDAWSVNPGSVASFAATGTGTLEYYSVDRLGNQESAKSFMYGVDKDAPVTTAYLYSSPSTFRVMPQDGTWGSGVARRYYSFDGGPFQLATGIYWDYLATNPDGAYGPHTLRYYSVDKAGNVEATKTLNYSVADPAPPTVQFGHVGVESPYLLVTESPNTPSGLDRLYYRFGGGAFNSVAIPVSGSPTSTQRVDIPLPDGNWWMQWYATDKAGNASTWGSTSFRVDVNGPQITIDTALQGDGTVLVTARASDPGSGLLQWQPDGLWNGESLAIEQASSLGYWRAVLPLPAWGTRTYEVTVWAQDNTGNENQVTQYVDVTGPTTDDPTPPDTVDRDAFYAQIPTAYDGGDGNWYYEGELYSTDLESGVTTIFYSVDGGDWVEEPAMFQETAEGGFYFCSYFAVGLGEHTVDYYAVNGFGAIEDMKTTTFTVQAP